MYMEIKYKDWRKYCKKCKKCKILRVIEGKDRKWLKIVLDSFECKEGVLS